MEEKSISTLLNDVLDINPDIKYNDAKQLLLDKYTKDLTRSNFDKIKSVRRSKERRKEKSKNFKKRSGKSSQGKTFIPPNNAIEEPDHAYIDDPDELLMSVAIRMLNMPNPNPQWANILLNCRKEKITNKNEDVELFKRATTQGLVNLLKENLPEES